MTPVRGTARKALGRSGGSPDFTAHTIAGSWPRRHGRSAALALDAGRKVEELENERRLLGRKPAGPAAIGETDVRSRLVAFGRPGVKVHERDPTAAFGLG